MERTSRTDRAIESAGRKIACSSVVQSDGRVQEAGASGVPLTPKEFAARLGVHVKTVKRWIQDGRIRAEQTAGKRGRWLIPASELVRFV
jgi:excisionase family DNA binding protein